MSKKTVVAFDLETVGNPALIDDLPEPKPDSRIKDPEKIKADIAKKRAEQVDKMALNGNTCMIVSCGFAYEEGDALSSHALVLNPTQGEAALVGQIWDTLAEFQAVITYNGKGFDVPVLMRRSIVNRIVPTFDIDTQKYNMPPRGNHYDLHLIYGHFGAMATGGLDFLCKCVLNEGKYEDGSAESSRVGELWEAEKYEEIEARAKRDAELTYRLWNAGLGYYYSEWLDI